MNRVRVCYQGEPKMYLLMERGWDAAAGKRVTSFLWVRAAGDGTIFLSEADGRAAYAMSGAGAAEQLRIEPEEELRKRESRCADMLAPGYVYEPHGRVGY